MHIRNITVNNMQNDPAHPPHVSLIKQTHGIRASGLRTSAI